MTSVLANPLSLFDVKGKVAIITGASGAFGALAAEVLAAAGADHVRLETGTAYSIPLRRAFALRARRIHRG